MVSKSRWLATASAVVVAVAAFAGKSHALPQTTCTVETSGGLPICATPSGGAANGPPLYWTTKKRELRASLGLQWDFGESAPNLTAGLRWATTHSNNEVTGVKVDAAIPVVPYPASPNIFKAPKLRVMGVAGNRDFQGEFGLGVRTSDWSPLAALGVQAPFVNGGVNYVWAGGFDPYFGVNTSRRAAGPNKHVFMGVGSGPLACGSGYQLIPSAWYGGPSLPASAINGGKTCVNSAWWDD